MLKQHVTKEEALKKIKNYCSYQERNHYETKEKLYGFGLRKNEVEELLATLIETDYLNEERFACKFTSGRFTLKKWGRKKIESELKLKRVSIYNIKIALSKIDGEAYKKTLQKLAAVKWKNLKKEPHIDRQVKTTNYLLQKGFEAPLVYEAVKEVVSS